MVRSGYMFLFPDLSALGLERFMANTESKKRHIDSEWFRKVLKWKGVSIRSLGQERGGTSWNERTIRRALQDGEISPGLLDAIAKKIDVYPDYLAGKYCWTLSLPVMDDPEICDYWLEHYMMPRSYPYILEDQAGLGTRQHLLNTLLIHGVSEEAFRGLDAKERHSLEFQIDRKTTMILQHWFPEADFSERVDYYLAMEWQTEADVMDALSDYFLEQDIKNGRLPDWDDDDDPFADDYLIDN